MACVCLSLFRRKLQVGYSVTTWGHLVAMSSRYLKELNTAIQCLGIKPKAIYK